LKQDAAGTLHFEPGGVSFATTRQRDQRAFWPEEHFVFQSLKGDRNHPQCAAISPPHCNMIRPVLGFGLF
jgi:hypothetical protein